MSTALRKRLYREGRRLLGPDRMSSLRDRSRMASVRVNTMINRLASMRARLRRPPWINVATVQRLDKNTLLLGGRIDPGSGGLDKHGASGLNLVLVLDDGSEVDLTTSVHLYLDRTAMRVDNDARAFAVMCRVPAGTRPHRLSLRIAGAERRSSRCPQPAAQAEPLERLIAALAPLGRCTHGKKDLLDKVLGSAAELVWKNRELIVTSVKSSEDRLVHYNPSLAARQPLTTIIVPVYGRHDFIAHQLTHFVVDEQIRASELIYVIDDPRLHVDVQRQAAELARQHNIAFSVLYLARNRGYAGANNAAARFAHGTELLLLNSDVFPRQAGWLGCMRASVNGATDEYVIGARLLYDDDSVQHDGIRFEPGDNFEGLYQNRHPGKGLPRELFPSSPLAQPREAVTGACLLVSRTHYMQLGGLDEGYVIGDFEDSDFCLKARQAGLGIAVAVQAILYHLEDQSQSLVTGASWKKHITHYNCWRHHLRWHDDIALLAQCRSQPS